MGAKSNTSISVNSIVPTIVDTPASEMKVERAFFSLKELKAIGDPGDGEPAKSKQGVFTFSGYGSVYGAVDFGSDVVEPGCFDESLRIIKPEMLWQHDDDEPVGVWTSILSDEYGLRVTGEMPKDDTFVTGRVIPQIRIGSVRGLSIGFVVERYYMDDDGRRHIVQCRLLEISLVGQPKNSAAKITEFKKMGEKGVEKGVKDNKSNPNPTTFPSPDMKAFNEHAKVFDEIMSDIMGDVRAAKLLME